MKTKKYKKLGLEVTETMHYGKKLKDIEIPKGWRLLKPSEAMAIWEIEKFDDWFYIEQIYKEYENKHVARFAAYDGRVVLGCLGNPGITNVDLGVKFCRELKGGKKNGNKK